MAPGLAKLHKPDGSPYLLLLVDDESDNLELLQRTLQGEGELIYAKSGEEAINAIDSRDVDLLISDQRMPNVTGVRVAEHLKARHPRAVRILLTGHTNAADLIAAINRGEVYRYLTKPWDPHELRLTVHRALEAYGLRQERARVIAELEAKNAALVQRTRQIEELNAGLEKEIDERTCMLAEVNRRLAAAAGELSNISQSDALTGLWNARYMRLELSRELIRARRFGRNFSLLYIDIADFDAFNAQHGRAAGDRALRVVAGLLLSTLRHTDAIGRYGDDEFLVILPQASEQEAAQTGQRLESLLLASGVLADGPGPALPLRLQTGSAAFPESGEDGEELIARARHQAGGNR
jgi:diguanylate cyclase (GGDEF)-like protein